MYASVLYWQPRELELLPRCVESLIAQQEDSRVDLRVVLVDNGCGALPSLPTHWPVDVIRQPRNLGFAGGHNAAMRRGMDAGADYFFLFNSDAEAAPGCLSELVAVAESVPAAAFVGPLVISTQGEDRIESAGQSFNHWSARHQELARGRSAASIGAVPRAVDAVSGCALLARARAVQTIGLLDESLFSYFEDMDWCLRARRAGYTVLVVPSARVLHQGRGSTGPSSALSTFYSVRNHMLVASRHARWPGLMLSPLVLAYHAAYLASARPPRTGQHFAAMVEGARAAWSGQTGVRPVHADRN